MASASGGGGAGAPGAGLEDAEIEMIKKSPAFWAKLGHHPYWPAKSATKEERQKYSSYQRKATQICVKFYGSNDIGWIAPTSLVAFEEGMRKNFHTTAKLAKNAKFLAGVEEANRVWDDAHGSSHYYPSSPMLGVDGGGGGYSNGYGRAGGDVCMGCSEARGPGSEAFLNCRSCGAGFHPRCAGGGGGGVDSDGGVGDEGNGQFRCRLCADGGSLRPAPAPGAAFRAPWSPEGGDGGEAPGAGKRGRGRPPRGASVAETSMAGAAAEARKRRASLALAAAAARRARCGHPGSHGGEDDDESGAFDEHDSECFVCKEPGMLIVCDAPSCRKAYHKPCLGLSAWGDSFYCPRHRCAVCRASEADLAAKQKGGEASSNGNGASSAASVAASSSSEAEEEPAAAQRKGKGRPPAQGQQQQAQLWKCAECPVSYCPEHLPAGINYPSSRPASSSASTGGGNEEEGQGQGGRVRQQRLCGNCRTPAPRVQLASILERSWARLATNYLALPFMRPFLHGATEGNGEALLDLVEVALRIRGLRYVSAEEYLADLGALLEQARRMAGDGEEAAPVREAMETLLGNAERFLDANSKEVVPAEALIQEAEAGGSSGAGKGVGVDAGAVAWRAELSEAHGEEQEALSKAPGGAFKPEYCPARTLEEWSDYLAKAPMLHVETQQPLANNGGAEGDDGVERGAIARVLAQMRFEDSYPHKSTLLHRDHLEAALDQQATLLRRCLEGHAQLRRSLQEEKAVVMEFSALHARKRRRLEQQQQQQAAEEQGAEARGEEEEEDGGEFDDDSHVVTLGDMHILKELQVANQNLRARLESKDSLLRQREAQLAAARAAFLDLQAQNVRLKEQLQQQQQQGKQEQEQEGAAPMEEQEQEPEQEEEEAPAAAEEEKAAAPASAAKAPPQPSPPEGAEEAKGKEDFAAPEHAEEEEESEEEAEMEVDVDDDLDETDRAETSSMAPSSSPSPAAGSKPAAAAAVDAALAAAGDKAGEAVVAAKKEEGEAEASLPSS